MPVGINALELGAYYSGLDILKSVQKSYKFFVTFLDVSQIINSGDTPSPALNFLRVPETIPGLNKMIEEIGPMPIIKHWHTSNVTIPQYTFQKEIQKYGPLAKSFPIMDLNGLDITVEMEEDEQGTIAFFINWLQRKIVKRDGTYRSQQLNRIDNMIITTEDDTGIPINIFWFRNVFFLNSTSPTFDYSSNNSIKYSITFGADYFKFLPLKAFVQSELQKGLLSIIGAPL